MGDFMRTFLLTAALIAVTGGTAAAQQTGTLTDNRDAKTYKTVVIGNQTWMAENLNYQTPRGSWCYKNNADSCKKYGRLYDWKTARTVCPAGWRLPSYQDWDKMTAMASVYKIAGKKLKSKSGWNENGNGTDDYGFSALPGGGRFSDGSFDIAGNHGYWWTDSKYWNNNFAYNRGMGYDDDYVYNGSNLTTYGYSVRCIADK
jgi:uncharacterized protein (TIGR02145 family)